MYPPSVWVLSWYFNMSQIARQPYAQFEQDGYGSVPECWTYTPSVWLPSSYFEILKYDVKHTCKKRKLNRLKSESLRKLWWKLCVLYFATLILLQFFPMFRRAGTTSRCFQLKFVGGDNWLVWHFWYIVLSIFFPTFCCAVAASSGRVVFYYIFTWYISPSTTTHASSRLNYVYCCPCCLFYRLCVLYCNHVCNVAFVDSCLTRCAC